MPFRRHFARKEAREHQIAQVALQRGDLKEWHKHEAKAHRAGRHARSGLLHTEYTSFKENVPPQMMPVSTSYPAPYPVPVPVPVEEPVLLPTTQSVPLMPISRSIETMVPLVEEQLAPNTIVEMGNEMEPTIIMEPTLIEEPMTIQEFADPMAPVTYIDELAQLEAYMDSQAAVGYTDPNVFVGSPIMMEGENVVYGEPQFVEETVVTSL